MKIKNYKLKVTQEIIDNAKPGHARKCMVADAIRLQIPAAEMVDVTADTIRFTLPNGDGTFTRYIYDTPGRCAVNISRFDDGTPIEPFDFRLQAVQCATKAVTQKGRPSNQPTGKKATRRVGCKRCQRSIVRRTTGLKVFTEPRV